MAGSDEDSLSANMAKINIEEPNDEDPPIESIQGTIKNISHVSGIETKHFQIYMGDPMKIQVEQDEAGTIAIDMDNIEAGDMADKSVITSVINIKTPHFQIYMGKPAEVKLIQKYSREEYLSTTWMQRKSCEEVHEILAKMGVENPEQASRCVKAAIQNGFIHVTGDPTELDKIIVKVEHPDCGHDIKARLGDCLKQPDFGGGPSNGLLVEATVACWRNEKEIETETKIKLELDKVKEVDTSVCKSLSEGRAYISNICSGFPIVDVTGSHHNHCMECPGFGVCLMDFRNTHCDLCGEHFYAGTDGVLPCDNCPGLNDTSDSEGYLTFK